MIVLMGQYLTQQRHLCHVAPVYHHHVLTTPLPPSPLAKTESSLESVGENKLALDMVSFILYIHLTNMLRNASVSFAE